jgi:transposase
MKQALQAIIDQLAALELQIGTLDRAIHAHHRANDMSCRLETVPGIGVIGATAIASTVTDPSDFKTGRDFAAWIGLVPRQHSTGGKERLGGISKQGDRYLRRLLVIGATAVVRQARQHPQKHPWIMRLLAKKPAAGAEKRGSSREVQRSTFARFLGLFDFRLLNNICH